MVSRNELQENPRPGSAAAGARSKGEHPDPGLQPSCLQPCKDTLPSLIPSGICHSWVCIWVSSVPSSATCFAKDRLAPRPRTEVPMVQTLVPCCVEKPKGWLEVTLCSCSHSIHQSQAPEAVLSRRGHVLDTAVGAVSTIPGSTRHR